MGSVFVLNTHLRHGLEAIRALGTRGVGVTAGSAASIHGGRVSRFTDRAVTYPPPDDDPTAFIRAIERELEANDYEMLLPVTEPTVELVLDHRERLEQHTAVPFPPAETFRVGQDKRLTVEAARDIGIPHPKTLFSGETTVDAVDREFEYPVVVKPVRGAGRIGTTVCDSFADLERVTRETLDAHGPVLFQEFVPLKDERGVYTLYDSSSTPVGRTVQRRLRSHPPEGGASTYRETVADPELVDLADKLLGALDWQGLAMVEFRIDARTGEPKLMEINPRLWGSLALSRYAGVNFPYLLYQLATGASPDPILDYDVGVRSRYFFTDVLQALERTNRIEALGDVCRPFFSPCRHDLLSIRDPLPVLGHLAHHAIIRLPDSR